MPIPVEFDVSVPVGLLTGRLRFPSTDDRLAYETSGPNLPFLSQAGKTVVIYADAAGSILADIRDASGAVIADSLLTVDNNSQIPEFFGPVGIEVLYARLNGGSPYPIFAWLQGRYNDYDAQFIADDLRLDTLEATDLSVDSRLDTLDSLNIANRLTTAESNNISDGMRLDSVEAQLRGEGSPTSLSLRMLPYPSGGDDTAAIQSVLDLGGRILAPPNASYIVNDRLTVTLSNTLLDFGSASFNFEGMSDAPSFGTRVGLHATGSIGADVAITAAVTRGSKVLTQVASTSGLVAGDLILLRNQESHTPGNTRGDRDKGELALISSVDSASQLTLQSGAIFDYGVTGLVYQKISPIRDLKLKGGSFTMGGVGSGHVGVKFEYALNCTIDDVFIDGAEDTGVSIETSYNANVISSHIINCTSNVGLGNSGYGVLFAEGSRYCTARDNYFENCRHFVSGGGFWPASFIDIVDNHGQKASNFGYDCHEPCYYWNFRGNVASGVAGGFTIRGQYVTVEENTVTDSTGRGILCTPFDGVNEQRGIRIIGNRIRYSGAGIEVDGLGNGSSTVDGIKYDTVIADNVLNDIYGPNVPILLRNFDGAIVRGNRVNGSATTAGIRIDGLSVGSPSINLTCVGNEVRNTPLAGTNAIRIFDVQRVTLANCSVDVTGNAGINLTRCTDATVDGCRVFQATFSSLYIDTCTRVTVTGGMYSDTVGANGDGIRVLGSSDVSVVGANANQNARYGIHVTTTNFVVLTGNNVRNNVNATKILVDASATSIVNANNLTA